MHHHDIDGVMGGATQFMDWEITPHYVIAKAQAFNDDLYFSWRQGGYLKEMLREKDYTAPVFWQNPDSTIGKTKHITERNYSEEHLAKFLNTRRKFPQISADLRVRWCSAYLKIDVASAVIRNSPRFLGKRTLTISGERAEESAGRAKYRTFETDRTDSQKRHVDRWRPVHKWSTRDIWKIIEAYKVNPHPAYFLGWGRISCKTCIFGSHRQWSTVAKISPKQFIVIADFEDEFGFTIHRKLSVRERVQRATPYDLTGKEKYIKLCLSNEYTEPIFVDDWKIIDPLISGKYGEMCGPT